MMPTFLTVMSTIGAIGIFAAGFGQVAGASMRVIGSWFRVRIGKAETTNSEQLLIGAFAGAGGSAVSSVIALLSMVDAGSVRAKRTPWILLGINLGATAACWLVALAGFHITLAPLALSLIALSLPFKLSARLEQYVRPDVLTGVALLMIGIDLVSGRVVVTPDAPALLEIVEWISVSRYAPPAAFIAGIAISTLIRSSVGTVVLAMSLLTRGWMPVEVAAATALGANIGLALTGVLAAAGLNTEARRTALNYLLINSLACIWVAAVFPVLISATRAVIPPGGSATATAGWLALFHGAVHAINPLVLFPLQNAVTAIARRLAPDRDSHPGATDDFALVLLPAVYSEALDSNLVRLQSGLARMAELTYEMLMIVINSTQLGDYAEQETGRVVALRASVKRLEEEISTALTRSVQLPCSRSQAEQIQHQQRTAQQLSLISDDCYKTMRLFARSHQQSFRFHQESHDELFEMTSRILDFLKYNSDYLEGKVEHPDWELANRMEDTVDSVRDKLKKRVGRVLQSDVQVDIKAELAFIDIVSHLEHVGDRCLSISDSVRRLTPQRRRSRRHG